MGKEIGVHLSYRYNNRNDYSLNGSYLPSILSNLKLIAEYDSKDFAFGGTYLLFNHLHAQIEMQRMEYFTGGLTYKIYLK